MTSYQPIIHRELFQQNAERIKYLINVAKPHKRKSKSLYFLVIVVNNIKNTHFLCLVKKVDQSFRKDRTWSFDELQLIDAKYESAEPEFEICFTNKQSFRWIASNLHEKQSFLQSIKQIINQYDNLSIKFTNMSNEDSAPLFYNRTEQNFADEKMENGNWNQDSESYQALTLREEADLERLLELEVENTINNAEAFTEKLSRDLATMDTSNIHDIMASEQQVNDLMQTLQLAIDEAFRMESRIVYYESLLKNVRDIVQKVEKKEAIVQTYKDNNKRLLSELEDLVVKLDFQESDEFALLRCDWSNSSALPRCLNAATKLQEATQFEIARELHSLKGVRDQMNYLQSVAERFSHILVEQLKKTMNELSNDYKEAVTSMRTTEPTLTEHTMAHLKLGYYSPFVKWLRVMDPKSFNSIVQYYIASFSHIYEKEFELFFEHLRERNTYNSVKTGTLNLLSPTSYDSKRKSLAMSDIRRGSYTSSNNTDAGETASIRSSEISLSEWDEFDSYVEVLLKTIDPVCISEQQFCNKFFDLENQSNSVPSTPVLNKQKSDSETDVSISNHSSNLSEQSNQSKKNEQLRSILTELFKSLENEFNKFTAHYDKLDGLYSLYFLVRLTNHVLSAQDAGSFLSKAYGNILINVKRNFDRYMNAQQIEIEEAKDPKRTKVGVLSFIKRFENFAKNTENIVKYGAQRRSDIDRWYVILVEKIFQSISRIAKEHQRIYKTPTQMIELENYHYLQIMLSSLKISCLESERKEAKLRYNNALQEYVNLYFRRPLEKLNVFFEGVQQKVQQGVREEEIGYRLAFSKQELRKVIKDCNLKDIKKGLEEMYKRVEKHASDPESTLIQVIWRSMQEEFIAQYKNIQEMIERCYPQANISLQFTIEDVLNIFSEIAQSH